MSGYKFRANNKVIQNLTRDFSATAAIYRPIENTHNILTGEVARNYDIYIAKKMVLLPFTVAREFIYDSAYTKGASQFSYGALYSTNERTMIFKSQDAPVGTNEEDHIVTGGVKYEIVKCTLEDDSTYFVHAKALIGAEPYLPETRALLTAGWLYRKELTIFALEELLLAIRFDVFDGTVPAAFRCLPIVGKNFADALFYLIGSGSVTPSTATAELYKEYGINGGITDPNIADDTGLSPIYPYDQDGSFSFIAGNYTLSAPQEAALTAAVTQFNSQMGRKP